MFRYYLLGDDTAPPSGLYAGLCHVFLVANGYTPFTLLYICVNNLLKIVI